MISLRGAKEGMIGPVRDNLQRIRQPVLIVWGSDDHVLPVGHARLARERLPDARLTIMGNCGHLPFLEYVDEFNDLVAAFLSAPPG